MVVNMYQRLLQPPNQSFFLFGARGTGKSTWLKDHFSKARFYNLLDEGLYQSLLSDSSQFGRELNVLPKKSWVVVDEVQRLPNLLNEVHRFMEERQLRFVLCGSSARKLRQSGVNLLAGRAVLRSMHPFVPEELGKDFDLEKVLKIGAIPLIWSSATPEDSLTAYVQAYLKEEIQAEALVRNLPGFARFLPVSALIHGQQVSVSSLGRDSGVARTTVDGYLTILEDTLIGFRWPAFEARLRVRERRHPKWYFIDPGLVRAIKKSRGPVAIEEKGALFEGWIAQLLMAYRESKGLFDDGYYWSPADTRKTEVDFLLKRGRDLWAVEVKSAGRIDNSDLKGLRAIGELKGVRRRTLVFLGDRRQAVDGIEILPLACFLEQLAAGSFG